MDEARAALKKKNFNGAIQLFTKVLEYPENEYSAEAQEFLGLVRQKNGQLAEARSEYEDYLRRYPTGEGNERVRQRLAGIITASGDPDEKLRITKEQRADKRKNGNGSNGETTWSFSAVFRNSMSGTTAFANSRTHRCPRLPTRTWTRTASIRTHFFRASTCSRPWPTTK